MQDKISLIKQRINCLDYAERVHITLNSANRTNSPLRPDSDNKSSFSVREDYYYDFGTATGGDVIDFCANYEFGGDKYLAIRKLAEITGVSDTAEYSSWKKHTDNLCNLIAKWHESLRPQDIDYLHSRRITDETISRLKIGFTGNGIVHGNSAHYGANRISIPYWKNSYIISYNLRSTAIDQNPKYLKRPNDTFSDTSAVWGMHTLNRTQNKFLVIAEGAFDALSFDQENYTVLATMGGNFSQAQLKTVTEISKNYDYVLLTYDNDNAGNTFTAKLSQHLFKHRIKFQVAKIPSTFKDISEYYAAGNELSDLPVMDGLKVMCESITDKEEFKAFALQAAKFTGKPEIADLFIVAKATLEDCSLDWLKELRKTCLSAPTEDYVAKQVSSKHTLKYLAGDGFYEYISKGYWNKLMDEQVERYISDEYGSYRKGSLVKNTFTLLKSDCISTDVFNQKPLLNFINGTLNLETYEFTESHSPSDLMSFQVDYPYRPELKSTLWEEFIAQSADNDDKRIALLQEIAGYILFPKNSLQKCAFLIGNGSNGKSVYINVLTQLFGKSQVTTVEMASLADNFQRITLKDSLLNVSAETKSDVKGTESVFKQIVAGDEISGCYKNKDFITFEPRCKMIFACNEIPKVNDFSQGFQRRMLFVKFVNQFKDDPDENNPNEYKANKNLLPVLLSEKSAIFNWVFEGYKLLNHFQAFTETDDTDELIQDFRETINPIAVFVADNPITTRRTTEDLYSDYLRWCQDNGFTNVKSRPAFARAFKQATSDIYESFRSCGVDNKTVRGFQPISRIIQTKFEFVKRSN